MNQPDKVSLSVEIEVNAPIEKVWKLWTTPEDIMEWNNLSDDWHNTKVENDMRPGGKFLFAMGLKDGSFNFDFAGTYDEVIVNQLITYTLDDSRKSIITFAAEDDIVRLTEAFEPNDTDPLDMQKSFCQAVLDRFKRYAEK
jgi:uncharacterized protein YndB with AHSA1/START domain